MIQQITGQIQQAPPVTTTSQGLIQQISTNVVPQLTPDTTKEEAAQGTKKNQTDKLQGEGISVTDMASISR